MKNFLSIFLKKFVMTRLLGLELPQSGPGSGFLKPRESRVTQHWVVTVQSSTSTKQCQRTSPWSHCGQQYVPTNIRFFTSAPRQADNRQTDRSVFGPGRAEHCLARQGLAMLCTSAGPPYYKASQIHLVAESESPVSSTINPEGARRQNRVPSETGHLFLI